MKSFPILVALLLVVGASCAICGCTTEQTSTTPQVSEDKELMVYCGAGIRGPMEEIAALYENETGTLIEFTFGGSAQLLSQIELVEQGDLYMPGATAYIEKADEKGYVSTTEKVVYHIPVIAVAKGNPKNVTCIEDLARDDLTVVIGDPTGPAIGKTTKKILNGSGLWEQVDQNAAAKRATVNELVVDVCMGTADATVIWYDLYVPDKMDLVEIPQDQNDIKVIPIGTLSFSENPVEAQKFADFVASDEGKAIFAEHGYVIYPDPKYES
ncbi:molybdate ABC transporter substrate-binding protein [Methanofollis fontis]|uniref:Molybdate ABC transporter substrate-binding protein n=1 Tax=Methanofollis fontis TaxID=2052832 RepID=A0A483CM15_9EURY|nr:molybdate ABC transporter substrate-binding protein [Methanofollis fontis]TAJ43566.1 molybdate ABC transporter substrate-binding protein [Methanofollis fontis]